ncbi:hypothetical protein B0H16DRAFT_1604670 [Mycena metata]|uniref:Uncharacterized protein n=1 Tax=Mycena metata TaxID=1033252 RepID=A0AAD7MJG5_9AGAR|nr:hypothetical protein B0H16DRAFT_1604670 [Mycena metata]
MSYLILTSFRLCSVFLREFILSSRAESASRLRLLKKTRRRLGCDSEGEQGTGGDRVYASPPASRYVCGCLVKKLRMYIMPTPTYAYASSNQAADAAEAGNAHNEFVVCTRTVAMRCLYTRDLRSRGTPTIRLIRAHVTLGDEEMAQSTRCAAVVLVFPLTARLPPHLCARALAPRRRHARAHHISPSPPLPVLIAHALVPPLPPLPPSLSPLPPSCTPAHNARAAEWSLGTMCHLRAPAPALGAYTSVAAVLYPFASSPRAHTCGRAGADSLSLHLSPPSLPHFLVVRRPRITAYVHTPHLRTLRRVSTCTCTRVGARWLLCCIVPHLSSPPILPHPTLSFPFYLRVPTRRRIAVPNS